METQAAVSLSFLCSTILFCSSTFVLIIQILLVMLLNVYSLGFPNNIWGCFGTAGYFLDIGIHGIRPARSTTTYVTRSEFCSLKDVPVSITVTIVGAPFEQRPLDVTCSAPPKSTLV